MFVHHNPRDFTARRLELEMPGRAEAAHVVRGCSIEIGSYLTFLSGD